MILKDLYYKNYSINRKDNILELISPMKYKKINLISLNKSIKIPSFKFNSLTNCSTNKKSFSFNINIPSITKNKFIPTIKKFNNSSKKSRNSNVLNLKSLINKTNDNNINEKIFSIKLRHNSNGNSNISNINSEKSGIIFSPSKFDNISSIRKNTIDLSRNFGIKSKHITLGESTINAGKIKSIFNKRTSSIKLDFLIKEIKINNQTKFFKEDKLNNKKNNNKKILLKKINISKENESLVKINNDNNKKKYNDRFLKFLIKSDNDGNNKNKSKNVCTTKKNLITKSKQKIGHLLDVEFQKNKLSTKNNFNINEALETIFYQKKNSIYTIKNKNGCLNILKNFNTYKNTPSKVNTFGIINQYLAIKYKSKEVCFNYIRSFNLNKSNSLKIDYNLIEMKLLHINIEYEFNLKVKTKKNNSYKSFKSRSKTLSTKKPNLININKNFIKHKKISNIITDEFWRKFSLLKNASFFKNHNKKYFTINKILSRTKTIEVNRNRNKKPLIKNLMKRDDFNKLKNLIYNKDENQFKYECLNISNNYDINTCDRNGNTLLILACMNGDFNIVKLLLDNGANPNCANLNKNTPLHYAISHHEYDIADLLIKNGANDDLENINGLNPWKFFS